VAAAPVGGRGEQLTRELQGNAKSAGPSGQHARWDREREARGCKPKCVMRGRRDAGHLAGRKREGQGRYAGSGGDQGEYGEYVG
jgi:hypothetical protein